MIMDPYVSKDIRNLIIAESTRVNTQGWPRTEVVIKNSFTGETLFEYERNYAMLETFEPFYHNGKYYALISPQYTKTSVVDLNAGEIVAEEVLELKTLSNGKQVYAEGFCPAEFYVPGWWDFFDGSYLNINVPNSTIDELTQEITKNTAKYISSDFGFVSGCIWGDDWSMKIQYLDLTEIENGIIKRDDRFGYISVSEKLSLKDSIDYEPSIFDNERSTLNIAINVEYNLNTGKASEFDIKGINI